MKSNTVVAGLAAVIVAAPMIASACSSCGRASHHASARYVPAARYHYAAPARSYYAASYAAPACAPAPTCAPACSSGIGFNPFSIVSGVVQGVGDVIGGVAGTFTNSCNTCPAY